MHYLREQVLGFNESIADEFSRRIGVISGKPVTVQSPVTIRQIRTLGYWFIAFVWLRDYQLASMAFNKFVSGIEFAEVAGPDAIWYSDEKIIKFSTVQAGYNARHMLKGLVHEIGHAVEDNIEINKSVWGRPPFALNYNGTPGEDFAESFMLYNLDPEFMVHTTPIKFKEMQRIDRSLKPWLKRVSIVMSDAKQMIESVLNGEDPIDLVLNEIKEKEYY